MLSLTWREETGGESIGQMSEGLYLVFRDDQMTPPVYPVGSLRIQPGKHVSTGSRALSVRLGQTWGSKIHTFLTKLCDGSK